MPVLRDNEFISLLINRLSQQATTSPSSFNRTYYDWEDWYETTFSRYDVEYADVLCNFIRDPKSSPDENGEVDVCLASEYIRMMIGQFFESDSRSLYPLAATAIPSTRTFILASRWLLMLRPWIEDLMQNHTARERFRSERARREAFENMQDVTIRRGQNRNGYWRDRDWGFAFIRESVDSKRWKWGCAWVRSLWKSIVDGTRRWKTAVDLVGWLFLRVRCVKPEVIHTLRGVRE